MNIKVKFNTALINKMTAIQAVFDEQWKLIPLYSMPRPTRKPKQPLNYPIKKDGSQGGGGGGTARGLRVNAAKSDAAKAARGMRTSRK